MSNQTNTASLANVTPAGSAEKSSGSNYKVIDVLTFDQLGSSPKMNQARAAKAGVTEADVKNFYIGSNGQTILRTFLGANPGTPLKDAVNTIRQACAKSKGIKDVPELAIVPAFEKMLTLSINGSDKAASLVKDKTAARAAQAAAIQALGLSGVLSVNESNNGTRTTITHTETPAAPAAPAAEVTPEVTPAKETGKKGK